MKLVATGSSVRGPGHVQDALPNQDALLVRGFCKGWCVAVCDGLGSRVKSHQGSRLTALVVRSTLRNRKKFKNASPLAISQQIQNRWNETVGADYEPYESTCLWAWVSPVGQVMAAQVGDGLLLIRSQGKFSVMTPLRQSFGNQTQTLARAKESDWTTAECVLTLPGDGVLLMTDGISEDLVPEQLEGFFDVVFQRLRRTNKRRGKRWLTRELNEWSTPKHGDDKSIAGIFRVE